MELGSFWYHVIGWIGLLLVLVVASIGLWRAGQLRKAFDRHGDIDKAAEMLADKYDSASAELKKIYDDLASKIDALKK